MKRSLDPLALSPAWHVDCRLTDELPEDRLVGTRFLVQVFSTALALTALLFAGWQAYVNASLRLQIRDWERRIDDNRAEVREINRLQREYAAEAAKIDQAWTLVRPQLFVSGFLENLGRTRPEPMTLDSIEWNDAGISVRGNLRESSERASRLLGGYVEQLRHDEAIAPLFREIVLTDIDRGAGTGVLRFEIVFRLKAART